MKILFSFQCRDCKAGFEELTEYKKETQCPECGGVADKLISAPSISLEGYSGSFPDAAERWAKKHWKQTAKEKKQNAA